MKLNVKTEVTFTADDLKRALHDYMMTSRSQKTADVPTLPADPTTMDIMYHGGDKGGVTVSWNRCTEPRTNGD